MSKRRWAFKRLVEILKERKRISVTKAAVITDYSLEYFKRHIMPIFLVAFEDCVDYDVENQELVWVCDREEGGENHG